MFSYIPKHHMTFSIRGTTICSKWSINFKVNWVFPHPEGPLTMELNGCLQDGSILQNEEDTGLNVILILCTVTKMFIFIYRMFIVCANYIQNVNKISIQSTIHQSLQFSVQFYSGRMTGKIWMLRGNVYHRMAIGRP